MTSKTYFCYMDDEVMIHTINCESSRDSLAPAVYTVQHNPVRGFYLTRLSERFDQPQAIFGSTESKAEHVITRYENSTKSVGVLLTGDKGSGKSLFTALTANKMIDKGLAVITVSSPFGGEEFNSFISSIGECVIIFDEFAKVYGRGNYSDSSQDKLLSLFDGMINGKRLLMVTENEESALSEFILNRPGRFMYHYRFTKIDEDVVEDYCAYHNVSNIVADIKEIRNSSTVFSMDILSAIVSEYKLFGNENTNVMDMCSILNIGDAGKQRYVVTLDQVTKDGTTFTAGEEISVKLTSLTTFGFYFNFVYDYANKKLISEKTAAKMGQLSPTAELGINDPEGDVGVDDDDEDIYLRNTNVVYRTHDKIVFEYGNIVIVAKYSDCDAVVWNKYLNAL